MSRTLDGLTAEDRRRLRRVWWAAASPCLAIYVWVLTVGRGNLLQRQYFDHFFDAQARALFDGHLDVPADVAGFEGFLTDGKTYIYFGPFPALLRMPLLALTDRFDGRLTTLSILGASILLTVATFRLMCGLRSVVRGDAPVGRVELWATAGLSVAVLTGPPLFLTSAAIVYHEATMWGLALAVAGFDAVLRWQREPTTRWLVIAALLITGALLSRQTIGLGPLAALGLTGAANLARNRRPLQLRRALALAAACLIPFGLSVAINVAKFDKLFGLPMDRQPLALIMGNRRAALEANPSYVGTEYMPTTVSTYFRPHGIDLRSDFPWFDFPREGPTQVGDDVVFDVLDWSSSLPATAPALTVLTMGGLVWLFRSRRNRDETTRMWPLLVGAVVGGAPVLMFAYVANRYLLDLFPIVLVGGMIGFYAASRLRWALGVRNAALAGMGALVALGGVAGLALALEYQNERGPVIPETRRARWIGWRLAAPGGSDTMRLGLDDELPPVADGALLAVGDCDGLYVGVRDSWQAVERGPEVGLHEVHVNLDRMRINRRYPLVTFGSAEQSTVVSLVRLDEDTARVDVLGSDFFESEWQLGLDMDVDGDSLTLRIDADPRQVTNNVYRDDRVVNGALLPTNASRVTFGRAPEREGVARILPGGVEHVPHEPSLCHRASR